MLETSQIKLTLQATVYSFYLLQFLVKRQFWMLSSSKVLVKQNSPTRSPHFASCIIHFTWSWAIQWVRRSTLPAKNKSTVRLLQRKLPGYYCMTQLEFRVQSVLGQQSRTFLQLLSNERITGRLEKSPLLRCSDENISVLTKIWFC